MTLKPVSTLETTLRCRRRMRIRFYIRMTFTAIFVLTIVGVFVLNADSFKVKVVEISGVKRVSAEKIYDTTKITIGENIFLIPVKDIRKTIIERYPLVKSVTVIRKIPSRVQIKVTERQPYACVTDNTNYYIIDNERIVLEKPQGLADGNLFLVVTDGIRHAQIGERLLFPYYKLLGKMKTILDKTVKGSYRQVLFNGDGIKIYLADGKYVLLGDGRDIEKKISLIPVISRKLKERNEQYEGLNLATLEVPSYIKKEGVN